MQRIKIEVIRNIDSRINSEEHVWNKNAENLKDIDIDARDLFSYRTTRMIKCEARLNMWRGRIKLRNKINVKVDFPTCRDKET